jgi:hypothetical protein
MRGDSGTALLLQFVHVLLPEVGIHRTPSGAVCVRQGSVVQGPSWFWLATICPYRAGLLHDLVVGGLECESK